MVSSIQFLLINLLVVHPLLNLILRVFRYKPLKYIVYIISTILLVYLNIHWYKTERTQTLYEFLNICQQFTEQELRQQYKRLTVTLHPDRNPTKSNAQEEFMFLRKSYELLQDKKQTNLYDQHGDTLTLELIQESIKRDIYNDQDLKIAKTMIAVGYYIFLFLTVVIATSEEKMKPSRLKVYFLAVISPILEGNYIWKDQFQYYFDVFSVFSNLQFIPTTYEKILIVRVAVLIIIEIIRLFYDSFSRLPLDKALDITNHILKEQNLLQEKNVKLDELFNKLKNYCQLYYQNRKTEVEKELKSSNTKKFIMIGFNLFCLFTTLKNIYDSYTSSHQVKYTT